MAGEERDLMAGEERKPMAGAVREPMAARDLDRVTAEPSVAGAPEKPSTAPEPPPASPVDRRAQDGRSPDERLADHRAIDRLADELLPALAARLAGSGLGEVEIREGGWRVRLRVPLDGRAARRAGGQLRASRAAALPAASPPSRPAASESIAPASAAPGAPVPARAAAAYDALDAPMPDAPAPSDLSSPEPEPTVVVATSPAVGFFRPRADLEPGAPVRAGDRLGVVDVLGVPKEVVAPADGVIGASYVESGYPVEYGQELLEVRLVDGDIDPGVAGRNGG